jgi:CRISPR-associated protein Csm4
MHCYRLSFKSPFHVDNRGTGFYEQSDHFIHSATLSAAIIASYALLYPEDASQWAKDPPFNISSAFPYCEDIYFLPRPVHSMALNMPDDQLKDAKKIKAIQSIALR